ncbi:MAG: TonB family protein [Xanthobacteraceae bacterium]|nr:TonB family protein [Xanthobacteraceae bacterium]
MAVCAVAGLHAAIVFGVPWPTAQEAAVTAPLAVVVVPQGNPTPSIQTPDPAEAVEVRPPSAASVDSMPAESEIVEKVEPAEQPRERPVEATEAKPVEAAAARAPDRVARAVTPPTRTERIDRKEQAEVHPERAVESATRPLPEASEADMPAQVPAELVAVAEPSRTAAPPTQSREMPPQVPTEPVATVEPWRTTAAFAPSREAQPVQTPQSMQFNPAATALASDAQESKTEVAEATPAPPPERAADGPVAAQAQPAKPAASQASPVRTAPQAAPAVERTGPVQQAMRTEPNPAMVRDRPDRGDPTIANDNKPAKEKQEKKKPKTRSMTSIASSASTPPRHSALASVSGSVGSANYRALVVAELNRRKFYPSGARDQRGVVVVTFAIGSSGGVTSSSVTRSSGVSALDGAVLQMMRSVSLPPPPGGSFRATVPVHFDLPR